MSGNPSASGGYRAGSSSAFKDIRSGLSEGKSSSESPAQYPCWQHRCVLLNMALNITLLYEHSLRVYCVCLWIRGE